MKKEKKFVLGVIPARYGSRRLPGKPLLDLAGKPLIQWVWQKAKKAKVLDDLVVATDDRRILKEVEKFGGKAFLTSSRCRTGTDRCAEIAKKEKAEIIVNIQGDEPLISPRTIEAVVKPLLEEGKEENFFTTAVAPLKKRGEYFDPNRVKVVFDRQEFALYFSRATIPYLLGRTFFSLYQHLGIYAYPRELLLTFSKLPKGHLEALENLEQLRMLEYGYKIKVVKVREASPGVDTPEDLKRMREYLEKKICKK